MKTAEEWYSEFGNGEHVTKMGIRAIQVDALRWAMKQIYPDGNPALALERIRNGILDAADLTAKPPEHTIR